MWAIFFCHLKASVFSTANRMKFFAAVISALLLIREVVALPTDLVYPKPPTSLIEVDADALVKLGKADLLKVDADVDIFKGIHRRGGHPPYPWGSPPLLDIDLDLIVALGKAKLIDVDLNLDIFKGHLRRGGPPTDLPLLSVDLDVILAIATQKLLYLGPILGIDLGLHLGILKRSNAYAWWYPLIDVDIDLVIKLLTHKILKLDIDLAILTKLLLLKPGPPSPPLIIIDLDLIIKLLGKKLGH